MPPYLVHHSTHNTDDLQSAESVRESRDTLSLTLCALESSHHTSKSHYTYLTITHNLMCLTSSFSKFVHHLLQYIQSVSHSFTFLFIRITITMVWYNRSIHTSPSVSLSTISYIDFIYNHITPLYIYQCLRHSIISRTFSRIYHVYHSSSSQHLYNIST